MTTESEWPRHTVAELQKRGIILVEDGNHGEYRPRHDDFVSNGTGTAFIRAADMDSGRVLFESAEHINDVALRRITKGVGADGDVLISHKGTVGKVALVRTPSPRFVCSPQTTFWRALDPEQLDGRFLYYYLCSPGFRQQLATRKGETDMADYVSLTNQRLLSISLPPISEQRAIAYILGTLDDKIELNRRMNETLEALARAIFKSWFVDFDPVRAKMAGRQPVGMDAATAALFPDRMQESEIGEIPAGWEASTFASIATNARRTVQPTDIAPGTAYIALEHMPRRSIALSDWDDAGIVESNKSRFERKEILFGKLRPYFHKVGVAPLSGVCSTDILVVSPKAPDWFGLVLCHASSDDMVQQANARSTGTKMPRASWSDLAEFPIAAPSVRIAGAFSGLVEPLVDRIVAGTFESRTLAALRDTLLLKLLSGELRIPDAEKMAEATL